MITFLDGPAADLEVERPRAPIMLRLVRPVAFGAFRVLSHDEDAPAGGEIYVYRQVGDFEPSTCLVVKPTPRIPPVESYRLLHWQPFPDAIRTAAGWQQWCTQNLDELCSEEACAA